MLLSVYGQFCMECVVVIVLYVVNDIGLGCWDVFLCLMELMGGYVDIGGIVVFELVFLVFDLLGVFENSEVWILFDLKGQLMVEVLCCGFCVLVWLLIFIWLLVWEFMWIIEIGLFWFDVV